MNNRKACHQNYVAPPYEQSKRSNFDRMMNTHWGANIQTKEDYEPLFGFRTEFDQMMKQKWCPKCPGCVVERYCGASTLDDNENPASYDLGNIYHSSGPISEESFVPSNMPSNMDTCGYNNCNLCKTEKACEAIHECMWQGSTKACINGV